MTGSRTRLLLVDDHAVVREGFAALLGLQADFEIVGQTSSGAEAVTLFRRIEPDITLMDLSLPDIDGCAAIRAIRREFADARIIVLTTYGNDERILDALRSGALGFVVKTSAPAELYRAIRAAAVGDAAPRQRLEHRIAHTQREPLSERERAVLERMVDGDSNQAIARRLDVSVNTAKSHVRAILRKLDARSRTEAVVRALEAGITVPTTRKR